VAVLGAPTGRVHRVSYWAVCCESPLPVPPCRLLAFIGLVVAGTADQTQRRRRTVDQLSVPPQTNAALPTAYWVGRHEWLDCMAV